MRQKHRANIYRLHGRRVLLVAVLATALLLSRADTPLAVQSSKASPQVLAFATDISPDTLLSLTNDARHHAAKSRLTLDDELTRSAQSKAEDMIAQDYWAHESPNGTQPWYFFHQSGYEYLRAGENLAYGFKDSSSTVTAWMNSPSHRANLLGDYQQVGFGVARGSHYQGGAYTVIVAHYATPTLAEATDSEASAAAGITSSRPPIITGTPGSVNVLDLLSHGSLSLLLVASLSLCLGAGLMFLYTHRQLLAHATAAGERFVSLHPILDMSLLLGVTALILFSQRGAIS